MINIAIAEDDKRISALLKQKIELMDQFSVKLIAGNGELLIKELHKSSNIQVVLMDVNMPVMNGINATSEITQRRPQMKVLMCTVFDDEDNIFNAILAGAGGYLMKDETPDNFHKAIKEILEGGAPMSPGIAKKALMLLKLGRKPEVNDIKDYNLTSRETEILEHLSKGLSYEQIAGNLFISSGTVRKHIQNIYRKLQVNNKVEAVQKAIYNRII
jgi:DNA-binding NarL/FixJ family response regulator